MKRLILIIMATILFVGCGEDYPGNSMIEAAIQYTFRNSVEIKEIRILNRYKTLDEFGSVVHGCRFLLKAKMLKKKVAGLYGLTLKEMEPGKTYTFDFEIVCKKVDGEFYLISSSYDKFNILEENSVGLNM